MILLFDFPPQILWHDQRFGITFIIANLCGFDPAVLFYLLPCTSVSGKLPASANIFDGVELNM